MNKILLAVVIIVLIVAVIVIYTQIIPEPENKCTFSGGIVSTANCCKSATDFPNNCVIGACGCSLNNSHETKICNCPKGKCFDGIRCIEIENPKVVFPE